MTAKPTAALGWRPCDRFGHERERHQNESAAAGSNADQRIEQKANAHIKRHPPQIKQRARASDAQKTSDLVQVADWLQPVGATSRPHTRNRCRPQRLFALLQVYDRVLPSHSVLVGLGLLIAGLFAFQGILDAIRGRVRRLGPFRVGPALRASSCASLTPLLWLESEKQAASEL